MSTFVVPREAHPTLYDHQHQAVAFSGGRPVIALIMEMGTGKSAVIAHEATTLARMKVLDLLIVVAPDGVHRKWAERELPLHGDIPSAFIASGWPEGRYVDLKRAVTTAIAAGRPVAVAVGYGAASARSRAFKLVEWLVSHHAPRTMIVLDESQRIKTPSARRTKALWALGKRCRFRRILTGTPLTRGYEDLYAQFRFLDPAVLGYRTYAEFKAQHCNMDANGWKILGYRNVNQLLARIAPVTFRARKDECLELPAKVYDRVTVDLSPEQRRLYEQLRDEYLLWLDNDEPLEIAMAITRLLRLQQIIGGHVGTTTEDLRPLDPCPRMDMTFELAETALESDQRVVIWARFQAECRALAARLAPLGPVAVYHGGESHADRAAALKAFQDDRTTPIFIGTQAAGGTGLDLTAASTVIYYSNAFSYEDRAQSEDRCHRIGQTRRVTYYDLVAPGTLDARILRVLANRRSLAETVATGRAAIRRLLTGGDDDDLA